LIPYTTTPGLSIYSRVETLTQRWHSFSMPTPEIILVLTVVAGAVILFVTERLRMDVSAMIVLIALLALRLIGPGQALYGFANQATATVACMLVLSAGLTRTGLVEWVARHLDRLAGRGEASLLLTLVLTVAGISAFLSNTATVAVFIPVAIALARRRDIAESRVLMPLSFASQFGGVCTLIGTSSNIIVNSIAVTAGLAAFGIFEFAKLGVIMVGVGTLYLLVAGRWVLPERKGAIQQIDKYRLADYLAEFRVAAGSSLIGRRWGQSEVRGDPDTHLMKLIRGEEATWRPTETTIVEGDILLIHGSADKLIHAKEVFGLESKAEEISDRRLSSENMKLVEALIPPQSRFVERTLAESHLQERFGSTVLAIQRRGKPLRDRLKRIQLEASDSLLLQCDTSGIQKLLSSGDLIVTNELTALHLRKDRAAVALGIMVCVLALAALNIVPIFIATLIGAVAMVVSGCLRTEEAYQAIDWRVIFLLGGILPLGLALEQTGGAAWIASKLLAPAAHLGPFAVLAVLYMIAAVFTGLVSNNAAAILLAPIALSAANRMGVDPRPFLVAIVFAVSTSFATPFGYQTNAMVYGAGGYRFRDFPRLGIPLNLIFWAVAVLLIPYLWPF
jgi:di/tricarboxylate transporter